MLKKELVLLNLDCSSRDEVLKRLSDVLLSQGLVKPTFQEALLRRESEYPTGLPATAFDIAIPHTVGEHTITPAMAVGVLSRPVAFQQMGSPEITLHPRLIFMLAINDPKAQLNTLKKIMSLIQNDQLLTQIRDAESAEQVVELLADLNQE